MTYLDANASSPLRPEALAAMNAAYALYGNSSSIHGMGRRLKALLEEERSKIAGHLNVHESSIFFTSGGTEANNWVVKGVSADHLCISAVEHDSLWKGAQGHKRLSVIPVDRIGLLDLNLLEENLKKSPKALVSVILAHNETGVIQPLDQIATLVKTYGAFLHVDAVQALGKIDIDLAQVDFATFSAHKVGGPQGVGLLYAKDSRSLSPLLEGGGQEKSFRSGTVPVALVAGFSAALGAALQNPPSRMLQEKLERAVDLPVVGEQAPRLPNTTCFLAPDSHCLMRFDLQGIAVSNGAACSSGTVKPSRSLLAMGYNDHEAKCGIRVSTGWHSTEADIDHFIEVWSGIRQKETYS